MFSLFPGRSQCVLLRRCGQRTVCTDCLSGPLHPRVSQCPRVARLTQQSCPSCPCTACTDTEDDLGDQEDESQYEDPDYDPEEYDDSEPEEGQDDVNIDDGLLDDVFEDEVAPRNNNKQSNNNAGGGVGSGGCSSCEMTVVCVMGGSNSQVSQIRSGQPLLLSDHCRAPCLRWPQWMLAASTPGPRGLSTSHHSPQP